MIQGIDIHKVENGYTVSVLTYENNKFDEDDPGIVYAYVVQNINELPSLISNLIGQEL